MEEWTLIVCFTDKTWTTETELVCIAQIDGPDDVIEGFLENYKGEKEVTFVGIYHTKNVEDEG